MRCPEECGKQWRPKQGKSGWKKQKKKEKKEKERKKEEQKEQKKKKPKKEGTMEVKRVIEEWEIWDEEEAVKSEKETKWLVPERFHKQIHVFGKKASKQMPTRKL